MTVARFRLNAETAARRRAQELTRRELFLLSPTSSSDPVKKSRFRKPFYRPWGVAQGVTPTRPGRWLAWAILAFLGALAAYLLIVCLAWGALALG